MHSHDHSRVHDRRLLRIALALILALMVGEIVAGLLAGSLALLADAGHMLTDAAALGGNGARAMSRLELPSRPRTARTCRVAPGPRGGAGGGRRGDGA